MKYQVEIYSKLSLEYYSLPENSFVGDTIDINKFSELKNDKIFLNDDEIQRTEHLLNTYLSKLNTEQQLYTKQELYDLTSFKYQHDTLWNITNLVRKYNITGKDVFISLGKNATPFGAGLLAHDDKDIYLNLSKEFDKRLLSSTNYVYVDWFNGCAYKNQFPIDINNDNTPFMLNMRRYNDRNYDTGFEKFMNLVVSKINTPINYKRYKHTSTYVDTYVDTSLQISEIIKENTTVSMITKHNSKLSKKIINESIKNGQFWGNHRYMYSIEHDNGVIWDYMMMNSYNMFVKTKLEYCELIGCFNFYSDNTVHMRISSLSDNNISIVTPFSLKNGTLI